MLRILKRDILRLLKAPAALIVVGALLVLPSLYTWYNVVAFWNPYEATGNLKVSVVNQDVGTQNELTGELDVGTTVTEELLANDKLDFVTAGYDEALADLEAGDVYAVYVIPEDFSECLISPLTGTIKRPVVEYYANEKLGPVSPKITDTAATTLEETINSTFVSTASEAATKAIEEALNGAAGDAERARSVAAMQTNAAMEALGRVQGDLSDAKDTIDSTRSRVDAAAASMGDALTTIDDVRAVVNDISDGADVLETQLLDVTSNAAEKLPDAISKAEEVEAKVDGIVEDLSSLVESGRNRLGSATTRLDSIATALENLSSNLEAIANGLPQGWTVSTLANSSSNLLLSTAANASASGNSVGDQAEWLAAVNLEPMAPELEAGEIADDEPGTSIEAPNATALARKRLLALSSRFSERASKLRTLQERASELDSRLASLTKTASGTTGGLKDSAKLTVDALQGYANGLFGETVETVVSTLSQVNEACERVSNALTGFDSTVKHAQSSMRQLSGLLGDCAEALSQTDNLIGGVRDDLGSLASDVRLLADSGSLAELLGENNLNPENIGAFLGAPTKVEKVEFYRPNAYGTAMAPLFMNLTFWIGAFMLVIIFKLEVDDEGLKRVTLGQRYFSRLTLFSGFAVVQALICCVGVLFLGVQVANVPALFVAAALASLAYLGIIYALSVNLNHIGKALCIILVFAQIPGGSGLYPLELTDDFFRALYPLLPFSYGIDALREAIFGFYGNYYLRDVAVLVLIALSMLVLGMFAMPRLSNLTRMAAKQIREGGLYNGEEPVYPARQNLLAQVASALTERGEHRANLKRRYARFSRIYPVVIRASIVLGIGVPVVLMACMALDAGEKVVLLTAFLLWLVGLVVLLLAVESLRFGFERELDIDRMSDDRLFSLFLGRTAAEGASGTAEEPGSEAEEAHDA